MVRNIRMKTFLMLSFGIILAIMIAFGGASLFFTQRLANQSITFYEQPHAIQLEVAKVQLVMNQIGGEMKNALVYRTFKRSQDAKREIATLQEEMKSRIAVVKERYPGDQSILETADVSVGAWIAETEKILSMTDNKQYDEAAVEFETVYMPLESAMMENVGNISTVAAERTEFYYESAKRSKMISRIVIFGTVIVTLMLTFFICLLIIRSISVPLRRIREAANEMAKGNLRQDVKFSGRNEFGNLADSIRATMKTLSGYVQNIDQVLDRVSSNDLTATVDVEYIGDFAPIKDSMEQIIASFNRTVGELDTCAVQVTVGAEQVAAGAQVLSQGAAEQAGSVEELSANILEISNQVNQNAKDAEATHTLVEEVGAELMRGNAQMETMLKAIGEINISSGQIAKIIKTIEDIAFQTNILALNAAVEAARAGVAGKGFAVVADEVRNLAGKSAEAAKNTTELIQNSIRAVENGTKIAGGTAETLGNVVTGAQKITQMVDRLAESARQQAIYVHGVNAAVDEISRVVQTNSATSEESAASSEELSGQAQAMQALVAPFRLKERSTEAVKLR